MSVLQPRITQLIGQATVLRSHRFMTSREISALPRDQARLERPVPAGMPPLSLRHVALLRGAYDMDGRPKTRHGARQVDGFCRALRRHQKRQLRLAAQTAIRHARALRKLDKIYVERPGKTEAELELEAAY